MTQMNTGQVPGGPASGQFRIASADLHYAGVSRSGDDSRWQASMTALRAWDPDIVLLQEMAAPAGQIAGLHAHLWRTANELGMTPLLGPPGPLSVTGNHPAILVRTSRGLMILDAGPPLWASGGGLAPAWCQALIQVPGIGHPVAAYSVHMPARSAQEQRSQAQRLASLIAQKGEIAIAGGDWNSFPRTGAGLPDLHDMDPHLRPPRMHTRPGPDGGITGRSQSAGTTTGTTGSRLAPGIGRIPWLVPLDYSFRPGLPQRTHPISQLRTGPRAARHDLTSTAVEVA